MKRSEKNILIGLSILIIIMVIGIGITFYVTRIAPAQLAYVESAQFAATQRQLERNLDRVMTPDG